MRPIKKDSRMIEESTKASWL